MVEHVVLLRLNDDAESGVVEAMTSALLHLRDLIPGIRAIAVGPNDSPEALDRGFDLGFIVTFEDGAARDAYLPHPAHRAVVPLIEQVAGEVLVFDLDREPD